MKRPYNNDHINNADDNNNGDDNNENENNENNNWSWFYNILLVVLFSYSESKSCKRLSSKRGIGENWWVSVIRNN